MNVPFELAGTLFQCRVWSAISAIRPGRTLTYTDLARTLRDGAAAGRRRVRRESRSRS